MAKRTSNKAPRKSPGNRAGKPRKGKAAKDGAASAEIVIERRVEWYDAPTAIYPIAGIDGINTGENIRDPRGDDPGIRHLAASMAEVGLIQPIILTKHTGHTRYSIVAGHRRLAAAKLLGWTEIPVRFCEPSEVELVRVAENEHRKALTAADRAYAVARIARQIGNSVPDRDAQIAEIVARTGWAAEDIRKWLVLADMAPGVLELIEAQQLPVKAAIALAGMAQAEQLKIAKLYASRPEHEARRAIEGAMRSVRGTSAALLGTPWPLDAEFAGKPACVGCRFNTEHQGSLYAGILSPAEQAEMMGATARCTNPSCYASKRAASAKAESQLIASASKAKAGGATVECTIGGLAAAKIKMPAALKPQRAVSVLKAAIGEPAGKGEAKPDAKPGKGTTKPAKKPGRTPEQLRVDALSAMIENHCLDPVIQRCKVDAVLGVAFALTRMAFGPDNKPASVGDRIVGLYETGKDLPVLWQEAMAERMEHVGDWEMHDDVSECSALRFVLPKGKNGPTEVEEREAELAWWRHLIERLNANGAGIPVPPAEEGAPS